MLPESIIIPVKLNGFNFEHISSINLILHISYVIPKRNLLPKLDIHMHLLNFLTLYFIPDQYPYS